MIGAPLLWSHLLLPSDLSTWSLSGLWLVLTWCDTVCSSGWSGTASAWSPPDRTCRWQRRSRPRPSAGKIFTNTNRRSVAALFYPACSFTCRRRLPSIMLNLRMAQNLKTAITFIQQGRILQSVCLSGVCYSRENAGRLVVFLNTLTDVRVGPDIVTDPAFLVTRSVFSLVYNVWHPPQFVYKNQQHCLKLCLCFRNMEDFVTWVDSSKIKQHVLNYNDEVRLSFIHEWMEELCSIAVFPLTITFA